MYVYVCEYVWKKGERERERERERETDICKQKFFLKIRMILLWVYKLCE